MADLAIRDMIATDLAILPNIEYRATGRARPLAVWEREFRAPAFLVWVAERDTAIVGFLGYSLAGDVADINHLAVLPEVQRQGVARTLLDALCSALSQRAVGEIFLDVRHGNRGARCLYNACGFAPVGRRRRYYADPVEDGLIYRRAL